MSKIIILGAGGHAKVLCDILIKRKEKYQEDIEILGFLDDDYEKLKNKVILGIPVIGNLNKIEDYRKKDYKYVVGIGNNNARKEIVNLYKDLVYIPIVHPDVIVGCEVFIGSGSQILGGCVINPNVRIGNHVIINSSTVIEHDCIIEDYVHVSPNSTICGGVSIGEMSWIGAGSVVIQGIGINKNVIIGAGSVVIKDIEDGTTVVGNPGKKIK